MKYNKIHDRYDIGLGLVFQFKFNHVEFGNTIVVVSNIPEINLKVLKARNTYDAIDEVQNILLDYFNQKTVVLVNKRDVKDKILGNPRDLKKVGLGILNYVTNQPVQALNLPTEKEAKEILDKYNNNFKLE